MGLFLGLKYFLMQNYSTVWKHHSVLKNSFSTGHATRVDARDLKNSFSTGHATRVDAQDF